MGFGTYPFGIGPFGADPGAGPSARTILPPQGAIDFNGATRGPTQLANGAILTVHPVDQEVNLCLGIEQGTLASAPTVGHRFRQIKRAGGPTLQTECEREAARALAAPLSRGDITILSVVVDSQSVRGRLNIAVNYRNERTARVQTSQVK